MRVLSKERFMTHENGRPVATGFVSYISRDKPILMLRTGREDYSDGYDDYADMISEDNGHTWGEPRLRLKSYEVEEGKMRYAEPAAVFDSDTGKLLVLTDLVLYPHDNLNVDASYNVVFESLDSTTREWSDLTRLKLGHPAGVAVSFAHPIKTSKGRLVFPAQTHYLDENGKPVHYKGCWSPAGVIVHILGDYRPDGSIQWHLSQPVFPDLEKTSRGLYEPAIAELSDGRFAMILRGDNSMFPDRPGYKWLSFSGDHCETWTDPVPLPCDVGDPIESGSNGSALFRSEKNGKLYWIGNLCIDGERPNGNWPRTPIVIVEVQENPFALKRDTITVIDRKAPSESPQVQHSNFRFYQDRENGDIVLFLSRYGETSAEQWMLADYYRYRVKIG